MNVCSSCPRRRVSGKDDQKRPLLSFTSIHVEQPEGFTSPPRNGERVAVGTAFPVLVQTEPLSFMKTRGMDRIVIIRRRGVDNIRWKAAEAEREQLPVLTGGKADKRMTRRNSIDGRTTAPFFVSSCDSDSGRFAYHEIR